MAELVIAAGGAALGSYAIPGTILGLTGGSFGWIAGSLLASAIFKPPAQQGPRLTDRTIVGTEFGQSIPWVAGSPRLAGHIAYITNPIREIPNTQKVGKGGGQKVTTYTYEADVLIVLTENVTEGVARDWLNRELVRNGLTVKDGVWDGITVYTGAPDQLPDPTYEAAVGAPAPAYRGRTSIMIRGLQLGGGKNLPNLEHQVTAGESATVYDAIFLAGHATASAVDLIAPAGVFASNANAGNVTSGSNLLDITVNAIASFSDSNLGTRKMRFDRLDPATFEVHISQTIKDPAPPGFTVNPIATLWRVAAKDAALTLEFQHNYVTDQIRAYLTINAVNVYTGDWVAFGGSGHLCVQMLLGTAYWFYQGVPIGSYAISAGQYTHTDSDNQSTSLDYHIGYPSLVGGFGAVNVRVVYGNARAVLETIYDVAGFTPPSFPLTAEASTVSDATSFQVPLAQLLERLLARAGYLDSEFSVIGLGDVLCEGYSTGNVTSTRAHLETLRPFGLYEANCSDKLYIFPRATEPVGTVAWEDLGASESPSASDDPFPLQLGNETELPAQIAVRYRNVAADWNVGTEFSDRLVSSQLSTQVVEMPFGMTPAQAKATADAMLKDLLAGIGRATLRLGGRKYARYEPGDVLTTTDPQGRSYRFRIITKRDSVFMLEWEVALDDAAALESPAITYEGYISTENPVRVAPTDFEVLAVPALRDADTTEPGPYVAMAPARNDARDEWPGAVFVRARLPEAFEQQFISGDACVLGTCLTTLADFAGGSTVLDDTQVLRVRVRGELSSATWADFFADRTLNAAVVGNEPIRYLIANFVENDGEFKIFDISRILRGQLGQELQMAGHVASERFVLLNSAIRRMVNETTDIGQEHQVKGVTLNTLLSAVTDEAFTEDGIALRPYSPVRLLALADTSGDLDVSWVRRSRLVARYTDAGVFAPLGEATEAYRVKVYDNPAAAPVRMVDVTMPAWTYAAADIAADGFAPGDPITLTVQQLSDVVGEGFAATLETAAP